MKKKVIVTGGAGYVGVELVHALALSGHDVVVYDIFWFSDKSIFSSIKDRITIYEGDIRDQNMLKKAMSGCDEIIHLACISNDPSYELDPELSKSINYDCFENIVKLAKEAEVKRFIYASSSSVYGVKEEREVTEDLELTPLTDYSKYKALCEDILLKYSDDDFSTISIRPATVCGFSRRLRLDVVVNILTNFAVNRNKIKVFGGDQLRPNIHIQDMVACYLHILSVSKELTNGKVYNVGGENYKVIDLARVVSEVTGVKDIETVLSDDNRSYHISSKKILAEMGFSADRSVKDAVVNLVDKFNSGDIPDSFEDNKYFNVKFLQDMLLNENCS